MLSRRSATALVLVQLIACAVSAQQSAEFGRATGGELVMRPKGATAPFSGSLELSLMSGNDVFGRDASPGYGITAGGTLLQERLWFFASATRQEAPSTRFAGFDLPENSTTGSMSARVNAHAGGAHDFSAFFDAARQPEPSATTPGSFTGITPTSFLSMRYDGVISSNMFFSASFSHSTRRMHAAEFAPAQ